MEFILHPIGIIRSPFIEKRDTPIQPPRSSARGSVEVYPEFVDGLRDLEDFSHIILIYYFHQSSGYTLSVKPFLDTQERGLFATRYPARPNQIGISIVRLIHIVGNALEIEGVDVLDGTPLLDIKPYVPDFDIHQDVSTGWYSKRKPE